MNKIKEYTDNERKIFGKTYTDIMKAITEIEDYISKENLNNRKYVKKYGLLKEYINLIDKADKLADGKGLFEALKSDEKYKKMLEDFKMENIKELSQLDNCSKCACLNCPNECDFDACLGCRESSKIKYCDHKKINITTFTSFTLDLTDDETGEDNTYKVLAVIQDLEREQKYIIIENVEDEEDKFILYYYPGIKEDSYGEITDEEEFDYIASMYQSHC
ncbi:DUF1292 domain-containing protein [Clostridium oceanicum]|uniref:DUF1292 domain-containing protein n=1 Tax=Clostridium oceanicum TaxID=1543 RepID=A0ABP3UIC5_9CLOT